MLIYILYTAEDMSQELVSIIMILFNHDPC